MKALLELVPTPPIPLSLRALATDFDGTLAHNGTVSEAALHALDRLKRADFRFILVTGRETNELISFFPDIDRFDLAMLENGAVLFNPGTGAGCRCCLAKSSWRRGSRMKRKCSPQFEPAEVAGIGNAENDPAFLATCGSPRPWRMPFRRSSRRCSSSPTGAW